MARKEDQLHQEFGSDEYGGIYTGIRGQTSQQHHVTEEHRQSVIYISISTIIINLVFILTLETVGKWP